MIKYTKMKEALRFCGSYERIPKLLSLKNQPHDESDWLRLLGEEWEVCDNIGLYYWDIREHLCDYEGGIIPEFMTHEELAFYETLPDELTVYRGCYEFNKGGFSWSLDKKVASKFPFHHRYRGGEYEPILLEGKIEKWDILAIKLGRKEVEAVLLDYPHEIREQPLSKPLDFPTPSGAS